MKHCAIRIQDRDRRLVRDTYLHRVVRRDDLIGLGHFDSVPRCNYRIGQLARADWLRRITKVNGLYPDQGLYAPGPTAAAYLVQSLDAPREEVTRQCTPYEGPLLVEHSLRALDFRIGLQHEAPMQDATVEEWLCESECLHEFDVRSHPSAPWSPIIIKPDGYFRLRHLGKHLNFFVEIDLGHVALPRFEQKLQRYDRYLGSGAYSEAYDSDRFSVLTVTVGFRRLSHLAALPHSTFDHLVTTWSEVEAAGVFRCGWTTRQRKTVRLLEPHAGGTNDVLP